MRSSSIIRTRRHSGRRGSLGAGLRASSVRGAHRQSIGIDPVWWTQSFCQRCWRRQEHAHPIRRNFADRWSSWSVLAVIVTILPASLSRAATPFASSSRGKAPEPRLSLRLGTANPCGLVLADQAPRCVPCGVASLDPATAGRQLSSPARPPRALGRTRTLVRAFLGRQETRARPSSALLRACGCGPSCAAATSRAAKVPP